MKRYYCPICHTGHEAPGDCDESSCHQEPLQDMADENTRFMLTDLDGQAKRKRFVLFMMIFLPIGILLGFFSWVLAFLGAGLVFIIADFLAKAFPPKLSTPPLSWEQIQAIEAHARSIDA